MLNDRRRFRRTVRSPIESLESRVLFAAGALDPSFGAGGVARMSLDLPGMFHAAAVQADGKVVVAGEAGGNGFVARFHADGAADRSFGANGLALVASPASGGVHFQDVEALPDGKILATGGDGLRGFIVAKLNRDGTPDKSFGDGGVALANFNPAEQNIAHWRTSAQALAVAPDGRIVLAGGTYGREDNTESDVALARFTAAGRLDPTFGGDGLVVTDLGAHDIIYDSELAHDVAVAPDGSVVIAGELVVGFQQRNEAVVVRYRPDGSLDPSFSGDGKVTLDWGPRLATAAAVKLRPDGRAVVAGNFWDARGSLRNAVAQLKTDGTTDSSFGTGGTMQFGFSSRTEVVDVHLQPDGKVIVGAGSGETEYRDTGFFLARLDARGRLDPTFGVGGKVLHSPPGLSVGVPMGPADLALAPDGRMVMVGDAGNDWHHPVSVIAARYLGDTSTPPPPPPPGGGVPVQAENGTAMQGAVVAKNNAGYTGTGFVDYVADSGGTVTWRVSGLAGPGNYVIDFRYANGSSSARRLQIDAANNPSRIVSFTPTGSWSTWKTLSVPVTVTSGTSVTITASSVGSNGPNLDSLTVRPAAQTARTFQAEQATIVGARVASDVAGYTGSGFVDFLHNTGDSIEWTVDNTVAGVYALVLRYANGSTGDRSAALWVNGRELNGTLGFASTGSWSNWREVSWTAPLNAGTNRIRLQANGRAAPNVDSLTLRTAI